MTNTGDFVHLHVHSDFSMLDGAAIPEPLVAEAARLHMPAIAITDHGSMSGAYVMYKAAKNAGIKPIIGIEGYLAPGDLHHTVHQGRYFGDGGPDDVSSKGAYTHITMLAETTEGMHNLFKISTQSYLDGMFYKPRASRELLAEHATGIIATTGCPSGEVQTLIRLGKYDEAIEAAGVYQSIFGKDNYYVEIMDHGLDIERRVISDLLRLSKDIGAPLVATNDLHYVHRHDAHNHEALLCVQSGTTLNDPNRFKFTGDTYYLRPANEMREVFRDHPDACDNTLAIAERCNITFDEDVNLMPKFPVPGGGNDVTHFKKEVFNGLVKRFGTPEAIPQDYKDRANFEADIIIKMGFPSYFLIVADFINWAKDQGILVGPGRGSVGGSLLAWALRITELDPIRHGLLFERFLNPERVSMPDIDIDFDDRRRGEVIQYVIDKYGDDRVAQIATFNIIKAKAAIKDASRVLDYPYSLGDRMSKAFPEGVMGKTVSLTEAFDPASSRYNDAADFRNLVAADRDAAKVLELARGLEGIKRGYGMHAAGVIMSEKPLSDTVPLMRSKKDGPVMTQFEYPQCEALGLVKMDFLGLSNLGTIDEAIRQIRRNRDIDIDIQGLIDTLDDPKTYEMLARGETLGVFQLDSPPMRALLKSMKPDEFDDISAVLALYRPGPMGANAHNDYADRKNGRKPVNPIHKELEEPLREILAGTYGLCVTGDTLIWNAQTGHPVRIDSISDAVERGAFSTYGVNEQGAVVARPVTHWIPTGSKTVLSVQTKAGGVLRLSEDHPVLTIDGWKRAGDLRVGVDRLATPASAFGDQPYSEGLSAERARILGLLLGDGQITGRLNTFTNSDHTLLRDIAALVTAEFPDTHPTPVYRTDGTDRVDFRANIGGIGTGNHDRSVRYSDLSINLWLTELGLGGKVLSHEKFAPEAVFGSSNDVIASFLAALWDTDGTITPNLASLKTISKRLAEDVALLFTRLGILAAVHTGSEYESKSGTQRPYAVVVYDRLFWDLVSPKLMSQKKRDVVRHVGPQASFSRGINKTNMLSTLGSVTGRRVGLKAAASLLELGAGHPLSGGRRDNESSWQPLNALAEEYLRAYGSDSDILLASQSWSVIVSIDEDGVEDMYDITVADIHNFLANGIVVHNCIYQEQIMAIAQKVADYSLGKADMLRRAMGKKKKEILDKEYAGFHDGMVANGYAEAAIKALWDILVPFADYAFNRAHSAGYGLLSYVTGWLKANYPTEYMAALLTTNSDRKDKTALYLAECRRMGLKVLPPSVNTSEVAYAADKDAIRFGMAAVRNVGELVVESIIAEREANGPYTSFTDFLLRQEMKTLNKRVVESLIRAGAFDEFGITRAALHAAHDKNVSAAAAVRKHAAKGQVSLFDDVEDDTSLQLDIPNLLEWPQAVLLGYEREVLGLYVSSHPLADKAEALASLTDTTVADIAHGEDHDGEKVTIAGLITEIAVKTTKKGDKMCIVTVEDLDASVEVVFFPRTYTQNLNALGQDRIVVIKGRVQVKDSGAVNIIADDATNPNLSTLVARQKSATPFIIEVQEEALTPAAVAGLKAILGQHKGDWSVHLNIHKPNGTNALMALGDDLRVRPSTSLAQEVTDLFGVTLASPLLSA